MDTPKHNPEEKSLPRVVIDTLYYLIVIISVFAVLIGFTMLFNGEGMGLYLIIVAVVCAFWFTLFRALLISILG